jgi:hydrogenase nickel incorporation protein HypB
MCATCGCGENAELTESHGHHQHHHEHEHEHVMADGSVLRHAHGAHTEHAQREARRIKVEEDILGRNDALAQVNRRMLAHTGTSAVNLMSSPGSGKTTLLVRTLRALQGLPCAVIEGDQQTDLDAKRIEATGVKAVQINTGKGCHLDAAMVGRAMQQLPLEQGGLLFIENVGNLVCPASFDLGEHKKVVVVSVTEGEDKPLKYPDMFAVADLVLVNKIDLLPHLELDMAQLEANVQRVCPGVPVLRVSARTGEGFAPWLAWLQALGERADQPRP